MHRNRYRAAMMSPDTLRRPSTSQLMDLDDADAIENYHAIQRLLGRHLCDVEFVLMLDGMLVDLTSYRAGLELLRGHYRIGGTYAR